MMRSCDKNKKTNEPNAAPANVLASWFTYYLVATVCFVNPSSAQVWVTGFSGTIVSGTDDVGEMPSIDSVSSTHAVLRLCGSCALQIYPKGETKCRLPTIRQLALDQLSLSMVLRV